MSAKLNTFLAKPTASATEKKNIILFTRKKCPLTHKNSTKEVLCMLSKFEKALAFIVASGLLSQLVDVLIEELSKYESPDKLTMLLVNILLVLAVYGKTALKKPA
jgi:hypothetical protein